MNEIIGDYKAFFQGQKARLQDLDMDISGCEISHLAFRTASYKEYISTRDAIEAYCVGNGENVWNGRPISKLLLKSPLLLGDGFEVSMIELIPPVHQRRYKMGLEHVGVVIGNAVDDFGKIHRHNLTGQQFQSEKCEPYYILFEDYTHVKFYRESLYDVCKQEGLKFNSFSHVENWSY